MVKSKLMKYNKFVLLMMLVVSWLSLLLFGKSSFKRFIPAGIFIALVTGLENYAAKKRTWWWWYEKLHPKLSGSIPFVFGPFMIGSMWVLKLTYGKFNRYLIVNLIVDSFFIFILIDKWLKKWGIASLVRMKKIQLSLLLFIDSLLLYGFQLLIEKIKVVKWKEDDSEIQRKNIR
ncbi:hypothetical protein J2Z40_000092 [Cytobacillus eiseniae]|uniref:Permease n=1 Tax=Cytobacillus eiseniae TaxID=762947 RepID=A0ABS4RA29_9BACI|nr:hypothetical protein [Cytobacillus eiseniae]MBP2239539.1 hypothetical protein [Cytobacillus eiseniae]